MRLFGGGLVVIVAASDLLGAGIRPRPPAGTRPTRRSSPRGCTSTRAGRVQVCTGKVEIGQNIRTSLAQTVADELRVPMASITMVMADTDKTPVRPGHLRIADDAAHGAAAGAGRRDRARDARRSGGRALAGRPRLAHRARRHGSSRADGRALTYGELTQRAGAVGRRSRPVRPRRDAGAVAGARDAPCKKVDGRDFVTGRHEYTPDVTRPGHRSTAGSSVPRATARRSPSVDDAKARAMARRDRRPRRRLPRRGGADRARRRARGGGDPGRPGRCPRDSPRPRPSTTTSRRTPSARSPAAVDTIQMPAGVAHVRGVLSHSLHRARAARAARGRRRVARTAS